MQNTLFLAEAKSLVKVAEEKANYVNFIAIVDVGGHLVNLQRMDGVQIGSVEATQKKARAAVLFKRPTNNLTKLSKAATTLLCCFPM